MQSKKFQLNKQDIKKWLANTVIFLAPALIVFSTALQSGSTPKQASWILWLWFLNTLVDASKKYIKGK